MGVLPTKGLTLPLMSYGRSSMLVTLAWVGMLLRVHHEVVRPPAGSAMPSRGGRCADEPHRADHGGRHRRARVSRRSRSRGCCARASHEVVWLGTRARHRGARRAGRGHIAIEWIAVERPARQGRRDAGWRRRSSCCARSGRRCASMRRRRPARRARLRRLRHRVRAASRPGSRGAPLVIHEQNAVAGLTNRWLARLARARARRLSRQLSAPASRRACVGNPVRARDRRAAAAARSASRARTARCACSSSAAARARARSNAVVPCAHRAAAGGAARCRCCHQAGERGIDDGDAAAYATPACRPTCAPFIDDMARRLRLGRPRRSAAPARSPSPSSPPSASARCWCRFRPRSTITRRTMPQFLGARGRRGADRRIAS